MVYLHAQQNLKKEKVCEDLPCLVNFATKRFVIYKSVAMLVAVCCSARHPAASPVLRANQDPLQDPERPPEPAMEEPPAAPDGLERFTTQCLRPDGSHGPCQPGNERCDAAFTGTPRYHVMDDSCKMVRHGHLELTPWPLHDPCAPLGATCPSRTWAPIVRVVPVPRRSYTQNDPCGPVYDANHGVYHIFYQKGLAMAAGAGPSWGHAVSRDLAHWAQLPVAIWNDEAFDSVAGVQARGTRTLAARVARSFCTA